MGESDGNLGNKRAADASAALCRLLLPYRLQVDSHRRKNWNVQDGKQILWNFFLGIELDGHTPKTQIENTRALPSLFAKDSISIGSGHGDALRFALNREHARWRRNYLRGRRSGADGGMGLAIVFSFLRRTLGFDRNRRRQRAGSFGRRSASGNRFLGWRGFGAPRPVDRFLMVGVLLLIETFVRNPDQLVRLLRVLRKDGNAMIHADGNLEL